jgi:hypothetical protein
VTEKGEVEVCVLLLSLVCNQNTEYWVQACHLPPNQRSSTEYQQVAASPAVLSKASELFTTLGDKMVPATNPDMRPDILVPAKNEALLIFFSRLVLPVWHRPLFASGSRKNLRPGLGTNGLHGVHLQLIRLVDFLGSCKALLREGLEERPQETGYIDRQMTAIKKKDYREKLVTLLEEKDYLRALEELARKTSQALDLYQLIFEQGCLTLLTQERASLARTLKESTFYELFFTTKARPLLLDLIHLTLQVATRPEQAHFAAKFPFFYNRGEFELATHLKDLQENKTTLSEFTRKVEQPLPDWAIEVLLPRAG